MFKQVALIVLDGWGYREDKENNAIAMAYKPNFDDFWAKYSHTTLKASGEAVGLPDGQMGNSEVGHMTIGAGRVLDQDLIRINKTIGTSDFSENKAFLNLFEHVKKYGSTLHVSGLLSDGGVHSHINHLFAFLKLAKDHSVTKIAVHAILDGRDTPPQSGVSYLKQLEDFLKELGVGRIASVSGRLYAMDRDNRWERLDKVLTAIFLGQGRVCNVDPSFFLSDLYNKEVSSDEYLEPFICVSRDGQAEILEENDGFFLFNFRADRMRMLARKIIEKKDENIMLVTMTDYGRDYKCPIAFLPIRTDVTLGQVVSENGLSQAHIAETEKFAHATYFLNCGREEPYKEEKQILIQSPKNVLTYDLAPKMSASKVADEAIRQIKNGVDFIFINFANADMVGHTANVPSIVEAIDEVDKELGRVVEALDKVGGVACITADHGNAEVNIDSQTKDPHTSHTTNDVPFIVTGIKKEDLAEGELKDVAPTVLHLLGLKQPEIMTGHSLVE